MYFRPAILVLFAVFIFASGTGCQKKSESPASAAPPTVLSPDTVARVHWLGKRWLDLEADAYYFSRVWSLPETVRLQSQTFDKLATGTWRLLLGEAAATQIPPAVLRPLFDDLAQEETYLEIRVTTNSPGATKRSEGGSLSAGGEGRLVAPKPGEGGGEVGLNNPQPSSVLAVHVNAWRAGIWETNLAIAAYLLAGQPAVPDSAIHGWIIQRTNASNFIKLTRVGEWTIVAVGPEQNPLLTEITTRIQRHGVPFVSSGTNVWLEADLAPSRLAAAFSTERGSVTRSTPESAGTVPGAMGLSNPSSFSNSLSARPTGGEGRLVAPKPGEGGGEVGTFSTINHQLSTISRLSFSLTGDGANVITRGQLTFSRPLPASLEPWHLPVELMHEPLTSFTAVRGLQSWLAAWQPWRDLQIGAAPDQLFSWSLAGSPYQIYLAAPLLDARSQVAALTGHLLQTGNPWLATNGYISFDRAPDGNGVTWGNLPDIKPFIKSTGTGTDGWLFAGLFPDTNNAATPPPAGLMHDVLRRTNLVYYDWEVTGPRLQPCLQVAQTARLIARQPQMSMDSASINWLAMLVPRLGTSATIVNRPGPAGLTFYRRSTLGLTALELHLLAGWLESPQFPRM